MSIQATVVLDSGILLLGGVRAPYTTMNVGYFQPKIVIYADGEQVHEHRSGVGKKLDVRLDGGKTAQDLVHFSYCMATSLLRLSTLYNGNPLPTLRSDPFDTIIGFNSGHFRCSGVKERFFYEMVNGKQVDRKSFGKIAHDILVEFDLGDDGELSLADGGGLDWSSRQISRPSRRLDIEILAEDSTAKRFFAEALNLDPNGMLPPQPGSPASVRSPLISARSVRPGRGPT